MVSIRGFLFCSTLLGSAWASAWATAANAADIAPLRLPVKAPVVSLYDGWSGLYFGGHVGYSRGNAQVTLNDPNDPGAPNPGGHFGSLSGGLQMGYNRLLSPHFLVGVEADMSFLNYLSADDLAWFRTTAISDVLERVDYMGTLRGRVGYVFGHWMVYATGGFALAAGRFLQSPGVIDDTDKVLRWHKGFAAGFGTEVAIAPSWSAKLEYLYTNFGRVDFAFPSGTTVSSAYDVHTVRIGLNYKLGDPGTSTAAAPLLKAPPAAPAVDWEIHGQTTYIQQGYPAFRSPYIGDNSLTPWAQSRNTWTVSAFLGVKLWDGGELYYNPELLQGFGLHDTTGAAGFPNGEAQKSNFPYFHYSTSRLFFRQTIGLGGEQEKVESAYGQMAGTRDVSRVTLQVGRFAVHDVFDNNTYAMDPRADFLNWSIWAAGAFDYPADKVGLGWGAVAELNQKNWAVRAGYFLTGNVPNSNEFDMNLFSRGAYIAELETRYALFTRPGKLRVGIWADTYFSGSYSQALVLVALSPGLDPTDAIMQTRQGRTKYGYYINVEQAVTDDIGMFARWSWNNGKNEISAFTDIDASFSLGAAINGKSWGRPDDKIGIAGAINALSRDHRDYIAAGGLGILIGDGQLNYRPEQILETFYAMTVAKGVILTLDYQFMVNPAHNADRGPVSFFSGRVHGEF
jgi:high affinity Mn2+ porin